MPETDHPTPPMLPAPLFGGARLRIATASLTFLIGLRVISAEISVTTVPVSSPLHVALAHDDATWRDLLAHTTDVGIRDAQGNTPLHLAALRANADAVDALLARSADANATNSAGATPLH